MGKDPASKKTMLVERTRTHYARSHGDTEWARVDEPLAVDLGLPTSYSKDLLFALRHVIAEGGDDYERALIAVDLPVRIFLRPIQVEQLVEKLSKIAETPQ